MDIISSTTKGLTGGIKLIFKIFTYILLLLAALSSGWLKLQCDGDEILKDFQDIAISVQEKVNVNEANKTNSENYSEYKKSTTGRFTYIKHKLRYKETLYDLERKYGVRWQVIKKINRIENEDLLPVGKIIYIPVAVNSN